MLQASITRSFKSKEDANDFNGPSVIDSPYYAEDLPDWDETCEMLEGGGNIEYAAVEISEDDVPMPIESADSDEVE